MSNPKVVPVIDRVGQRGALVDPAQSGQELAQVRLGNGEEVTVRVDDLVPEADGGYLMQGRFADLREAATGRPGQPGDVPEGPPAESESLALPLVEERAQVGRRQVVTGRVRVTRVVHEREETFDEPLLQEEVEVTRVPVERWVDAPPGIRREGGTLIVPVTEEVLVVEKRLRIREELHITRHVHQERRPERVTLRREEAVVERTGPGGTEDAGQGTGNSGQTGP